MIDYDHVSILTASLVPSDWPMRRVAHAFGPSNDEVAQSAISGCIGHAILVKRVAKTDVGAIQSCRLMITAAGQARGTPCFTRWSSPHPKPRRC